MSLEEEKVVCEFITPSVSVDNITIEIPLTWYKRQMIRAYRFFNKKNYLRIYKEKKIEFMVLGAKLQDFTTLKEHITTYVG